MKLSSVIAIILAATWLPVSHAARTHPSMAVSLQRAAVQSFLRTNIAKHIETQDREIAFEKERIATQDKEIAFEKEQASIEQDQVEYMASKLDLEERRMASLTARVNILEQNAPAAGAKLEAKEQDAISKLQARVNVLEQNAVADRWNSIAAQAKKSKTQSHTRIPTVMHSKVRGGRATEVKTESPAQTDEQEPQEAQNNKELDAQLDSNSVSIAFLPDDSEESGEGPEVPEALHSLTVAELVPLDEESQPLEKQDKPDNMLKESHADLATEESKDAAQLKIIKNMDVTAAKEVQRAQAMTKKLDQQIEQTKEEFKQKLNKLKNSHIVKDEFVKDEFGADVEPTSQQDSAEPQQDSAEPQQDANEVPILVVHVGSPEQENPLQVPQIERLAKDCHKSDDWRKDCLIGDSTPNEEELKMAREAVAAAELEPERQHEEDGKMPVSKPEVAEAADASKEDLSEEGSIDRETIQGDQDSVRAQQDLNKLNVEELNKLSPEIDRLAKLGFHRQTNKIVKDVIDHVKMSKQEQDAAADASKDSPSEDDGADSEEIQDEKDLDKLTNNLRQPEDLVVNSNSENQPTEEDVAVLNKM